MLMDSLYRSWKSNKIDNKRFNFLEAPSIVFSELYVINQADTQINEKSKMLEITHLYAAIGNSTQILH